jgi:mannose-1-phosphate guanylyltransferase
MYAVILAGGSGTRQRPLRGTNAPAAFQSMDDGRTLLQHTAQRLAGMIDPADVVVVTDRRHGQLVREQVPESRIVTEPLNRGTAASLALATVAVERSDTETMVVACADHEMEREDMLREALTLADRELVGGADELDQPLITFGVRPTGPDRELTYLQPGYDGLRRVGPLRVYPVQSVEAKPDNGRTRQLYEAGTYYWSSGNYCWQRGAIVRAIERYTPLFTLLRPAHHSEIALNAAYDRLQPLSIDEALLVGAARDGALFTIPLELGWRDLTANT